MGGPVVPPVKRIDAGSLGLSSTGSAGVLEQLGEVARRLVEVGRAAGDDDVLEALDLADLAGDVVHVLLVHDQGTHAGGLEDVGDTGPSSRVVDGHLDRAGAEDAEPRVQELRPGRHHHRDPVAPADPHLLQAGGETARALRQLLVAHRLVIDQGKRARAVSLRL